MNCARETADKVLKSFYNKNFQDWNAIKTKMRDELSHLMYEKTKRSPMILPIFMEV